MRPFFACAAKCELDARGKEPLLPRACAICRSDENVAVIGCDDHAELWDSEAWAPVHLEETTPEYIAAMMKELNF